MKETNMLSTIIMSYDKRISRPPDTNLNLTSHYLSYIMQAD